MSFKMFFIPSEEIKQFRNSLEIYGSHILY